MLYRLIKRLYSNLFLNASINKMALANSTGLLIGLLPLFGFRAAIVVLISVFFKLNLIALFMGVFTAITCPILLNMLISTMNKLDTVKSITIFSYTINFDEIFFLSYSNRPLLFFAAITTILSISFSYIFINSYYQSFSKMSFAKKISISGISTIVALLGLLLLSNGNIVGVVIAIILFLFLGYDFLGLLASSMISTVIMWSLVSITPFWGKYEFSENKLALFVSGLQSPQGLIHIINERQYGYFLVMIMYIILSYISYPIFKRIYSRRSKQQENTSQTYVFKDGTGKRWSKVKGFSASVAVIIIIIATLFSAGTIPIISLPISSASAEDEKLGITKENSNNNQQADKIDSYGFYVNWDAKSKESLAKNIESIDVLIPCWFQLNNELSIDSFVDKSIDKLAFDNNIKVIPLVNNYINDKWDNEMLHKLLSSNENRKRFIDEIYKIVKSNKYQGINIDFENLDVNDRDNFTTFMSELYSVFNKEGLIVIVDLPADDKAFDYSELGKYADYVVLMLYDQHATETKSGPIASRNWFEDCLVNSQIPNEKIIVGLGSYGYDWTLGSDSPAVSLTYDQVIYTAISYNAKVNWNKEYSNTEYRYFKGNEEHSLWFLDSVSLYNKILYSRELGIDKFALWRLGSEDPLLWEVMRNTSNTNLCNEILSQKPYNYEVNYTFGNEIVDNISYAKKDTRKLEFDEHGFIIDVDYYSKPLESSDLIVDGELKKIAITFDDGPHPVYTPQILDILKEYNVKATFFVVGKNAMEYPNIVKRIYDEGHDIGNHTYSHIDMLQSSELKIKYELNLTQKIIEMLTGYSTNYFRQPYNVDMIFSSSKQNDILKMINDMGYTIVGSFIDPKDWEGHSAIEIVNNVDKNLEKGSIVLLHDYGIFSNNTVEALPLIIQMLQDKGHHLVSVSNLMDIDRNDVMQPVTIGESAYFAAIYYVLMIFNNFKAIISWILIFATTIGIIRAIFLLIFSSKQKKKYRQKYFKYNYNPLVSIVIAAYNEEKVICSTVHSILKSDYGNIEVLVVDDGSKDNTAKRVLDTFDNDSKVRLITKENGGKSSAVNKGFKEARGEIVIVIDADTLLDPNAVSLLIRHFEDKNVAAVSGNVKIGNKNNLLTLWQHIEYVTGLNLERRAFDELNCIPVVPGAIGAWRKDLVASLGYYKEDTLAEDADITIEFLKQGYKIVYEEGARAFTEAPEDIVSFLKQRLRWSYGTLQCLWKHRGSLFNPKNKRVGFIAMPHMWLYQFIFQLVSPTTDILFIVGLLGKNPSASVGMYFAFLVMDLLVTLHAFRLEGENPKPLVWIFLQRIIYRQFMTYVVFKSVFCAIKGVKVGWNKLIRKGNVKTQNERTTLLHTERLSA